MAGAPATLAGPAPAAEALDAKAIVDWKPEPSPPKVEEAHNYRNVEVKRKRLMGDKDLPHWFGRHPSPARPEKLVPALPGQVEEPTKREAMLRRKLRAGEVPSNDEFDRVVQVFAQRARQEFKWVPEQRQEFLRRAKRWAGEAKMQQVTLSQTTLRTILLGCSSLGDATGCNHWAEQLSRRGPLGRFEYNALITAYGVEGRPREAAKEVQKMEEAGIAPDARSYAGIADGWRVLGNRAKMLAVLKEVQHKEDAGALGEPLDARDAGLPYYVVARSFAAVGDAPRAISVLAAMRQRGLPVTAEVHRIRLEAHLKTAPRRRDLDEVTKAFMDLLASREGDELLYDISISDMLVDALGLEQYEAMLQEFQLELTDVVRAPDDGRDAIKTWRRAKLQVMMQTRRKAFNTGKQVLRHDSYDEEWQRRRESMRDTAKMGDIKGGKRLQGPEGLPEWMALPGQELYGWSDPRPYRRKAQK